MSVNRSILKKSRHLGFGVFIDCLSMFLPLLIKKKNCISFYSGFSFVNHRQEMGKNNRKDRLCVLDYFFILLQLPARFANAK
jgi:hypothetical protein